MDYYVENDRVLLARILVNEFPTSVIHFLATSVDEAKVAEEFRACCIRESKDPREVLSRARAGLNQSSSVHDLRHPQSPVSLPLSGGHGPTMLREPGAPPSPPATTAGSVVSHGRRRHSNEIFIAVIDGKHERQRLSMLKADVHYNWIRADIVRDRLQLEPKPCEGNGFVEPRYGNYTGRLLHATEQVSIQWQRAESMRTEHMVCFLAYEDIEADIIMGEQPVIPTSMNVNASRASSVASPQLNNSRTFPVDGPDHRDFTAGKRSTNFSMGDSTLRRFAEANATAGMSFEDSHAAGPDSQHATRQEETTWQTAPTSSPNEGNVPAQRGATGSKWSVRVRTKWGGKTKPVFIHAVDNEQVVFTKVREVFQTMEFNRSTLQLRLSTSRDRGADVDEVFVSFNQRDMPIDWREAQSWIADHIEADIFGDIGPLDAPG